MLSLIFFLSLHLFTWCFYCFSSSRCRAACVRRAGMVREPDIGRGWGVDKDIEERKRKIEKLINTPPPINNWSCFWSFKPKIKQLHSISIPPGCSCIWIWLSCYCEFLQQERTDQTQPTGREIKYESSCTDHEARRNLKVKGVTNNSLAKHCSSNLEWNTAMLVQYIHRSSIRGLVR